MWNRIILAHNFQHINDIFMKKRFFFVYRSVFVDPEHVSEYITYYFILKKCFIFNFLFSIFYAVYSYMSVGYHINSSINKIMSSAQHAYNSGATIVQFFVNTSIQNKSVYNELKKFLAINK